MPNLRQGDIFEIGRIENFGLSIVFGHIGFNSLTPKWQAFRKHVPIFARIDNPFDLQDTPVQYQPGSSIWFVKDEEDHGMSNELLIAILNEALDLAETQNVRRVITNGIRGVSLGVEGDSRRASDDRRASYLLEFAAQQEEQRKLDITLANLSDVFVRIARDASNDFE